MEQEIEQLKMLVENLFLKMEVREHNYIYYDSLGIQATTDVTKRT